jgi:sulfur-carrier protein
VKTVQINVRLFATLRNNRDKEMMMDLPEGATPKDIFQRLNISEEEVAIVMINGIGSKFDKVLIENDRVGIFPPVGGG